ncbi:alpha-hydroxy acid oxidase [Cellulomonas aerilata]|uniref:Alpha-hydroxy-acid oxidizing enzyme n=1 Tax=Cellulomonas aerilata TaxID=515326 RepID=A0A512DF45_9CELL|nr:alpha-hydroxy acid oxidase [Cellulomonas aerilata]GEO35075.1 alpha-hydroxy-acid oxidizing enzyme [Cellulomonas aerilata]
MGLTVLDGHLRTAAETLPSEVFEYYSSGAGDERTVDEAAEAWSRFRMLPRVLRDVGTVDLRTRLLGDAFASPVAIAPAAFQTLAHPDGELAIARAARATGTLYGVSTRAGAPLEDIAAEIGGPWWFQVYVMRDRDLTRRLVERAVAAGARALVVTGDTPVVGLKRRVTGTRIAIPDDSYLVNLERHLAGVGSAQARAAAEQDPTVTLDVIGWLHRISGLPVLVKGVLRGDDARACLDAGAAGVVVSNHGGRQLDRSLPSALALAGVVDAVGDRGVVLVDGGLRSGLDCLVALALGASAVLVGRPVIWGLAADGADGVTAALRSLGDDLAHVMALAGAASLAQVDRSLVAGAQHAPG